MTDSEYDLTVSKKALGALYPILKDAHGNIVDGFHRQNADPDWPCVTLGFIDDPVKLELARLAANSLRRTIPATEMQQRISFLVGAGLKPDDIADKTGLSKTTIYKYMPQDLKDSGKAQAGMLGGSAPRANQTVTTHETPQQIRVPASTDLVSCDNCKMATHITRLKNLNDQDLCPLCYSRLVKLPKAGESKASVMEPQVKDKWEHRVAAMHVQHSQMEVDLRVKLSGAGYECEMDHMFILETTKPDFWFPKQNLAVYLDGDEVHKGKRSDTDRLLRGKLVQYYGVRVVSLPYKGNSQALLETLFNEIVNEASFGGP